MTDTDNLFIVSAFGTVHVHVGHTRVIVREEAKTSRSAPHSAMSRDAEATPETLNLVHSVQTPQRGTGVF